MREEVIKPLMTMSFNVDIIWKDGTKESIKHAGKFSPKYKDGDFWSIIDDHKKFGIHSITNSFDDEVSLTLFCKNNEESIQQL